MKLMGRKVIWKESVFAVLYVCRRVLSLDGPWCTRLTLESGTRPLSLVRSIILVADKVLAKTLQLSVRSPELAQRHYSSSPRDTLLHSNYFSSAHKPSRNSCQIESPTMCNSIIYLSEEMYIPL